MKFIRFSTFAESTIATVYQPNYPSYRENLSNVVCSVDVGLLGSWKGLILAKWRLYEQHCFFGNSRSTSWFLY